MKTKSAREGRPTRARARVEVSVRCAYCHDDLTVDERRFCAACLAPHHAECWIEHGLCSAPGCGELRVLRPEVPTREGREGRKDGRGKRQGAKRRRRSPDANLARRLTEQANLALVLGLVSVCACGLAAPFALNAAREATRLARRGRLPVPAGATVGLVGGGIGLVGLALGILVIVLQVAALTA